jgi:hypothetical protein
MSGGAGDRGQAIGGDRPALGRIRTVRAELISLSGDRIAVADLIIGAELPACCSYCGDVFLLDPDHVRGGLVYRQARPYRLEALLIDEIGQ